MPNLVPDRPPAEVFNYWCTWSSQSRMRDAEAAPAPGQRAINAKIVQMRAMLSEDFLFGRLGMLTNYFQGIRGDLIVVLDDGWDVPAIDHQTPPRFFDPFGSLVLFAERFPSFAVPGHPEESLKRLGDKIKSLGYRGLGLWVSPQVPRTDHDREATWEEAQAHWDERARWAAYADIKVWKIDWGYHDSDPAYRRMMTEAARRHAPGLLVEHALVQGPVNVPPEKRPGAAEAIAKRDKKIAGVLPLCDLFRTYDIIEDFRHVTTLARVAEVLRLKSAPLRPDLRGIINIENEMYIGASLGCSLGIMKHAAWLDHRPDFLPPPDTAYDAVTRAVRWQRIMPPFSIYASEDKIAADNLVDEEDLHQTAWPNINELWHEDAPAAIARNAEIPQAFDAGAGVPFLTAARHPNGAYALAAHPRTLGADKINFLPAADVRADRISPDSPIGIFGEYATLTLKFTAPVGGKKIWAQDLLDDEARDITSRVRLSGDTLTIPGQVIHEIGLRGRTRPDDTSAPGLVMALKDA